MDFTRPGMAYLCDRSVKFKGIYIYVLLKDQWGEIYSDKEYKVKIIKAFCFSSREQML